MANVTIVRSARKWLPIKLTATCTPGQTTALEMDITDMDVNQVPFGRESSIVAVSILLDTPVTNGFIRFEMTNNGTGVGQTVDMDNTTGTARIWEIKPGKIVFAKGNKIGINWGSNATMAPASVKAYIFVEVQD